MICSSSKTAPAFCASPLDTNQAATSFSLTYAPVDATTASNSAANCPPPAATN